MIARQRFTSPAKGVLKRPRQLHSHFLMGDFIPMSDCRLPSAGFTLVEVLVATLLLSGGLLGMAALQAGSLSDSQRAYNRSLATGFASDLADRMRANPLGKNTYTSIDPKLAAAVGDCLIKTGCSPAAMAQTDLFEWNRDLVNSLPHAENVLPSGTINELAGVFTITIIWDDNRDGVLDSDDPSFQTSFRL